MTRLALGLSVPIFALSLYFCLLGPRLPVADGLGWDGQLYGALAKEPGLFLEMLGKGGIDSYRAFRVFPSLIVGSVCYFLGVKPATEHVVIAFSLLNLTALVISQILWWDVVRVSGIGRKSAAIAFCGLFLTFPAIRMNFYAPVTTDAFAILLSFFSLWIYVRGKKIMWLAVIIPVVFTWPAGLPALFILMALRKQAGRAYVSAWPNIPPIAVTVFFIFLAGKFFFLEPRPPRFGSMAANFTMLPLSLLITASYVYYAVASAHLEKNLMGLRMDRKGALTALSLGILVFSIQRWIASVAPPSGGMDAWTLLRGIVTTSSARPALFLVAHLVFWGPCVLLFIMRLPHICSLAAKEQYPLYLVLLFYLAMSPLSETRQLTFFLPFIMFLLSLSLSSHEAFLTSRHYVPFFILAIVSSRFWLPMESGPFGDDLLSFPAQIIFMHIGPWIGAFGYAAGLFQLAISVAICGMIHLHLSRKVNVALSQDKVEQGMAKIPG